MRSQICGKTRQLFEHKSRVKLQMTVMRVENFRMNTMGRSERIVVYDVSHDFTYPFTAFVWRIMAHEVTCRPSVSRSGGRSIVGEVRVPSLSSTSPLLSYQELEDSEYSSSSVFGGGSTLLRLVREGIIL